MMRILVATDIHGMNDKLRNVFRGLGRDVSYVSPWDGDGVPFDTEREAVAAFHAENGLARYQRKIADAVASSPAFLIGFSVGATSLWLYAASEACHPDSRAILYYGSRIRDHLSLIPRCPTSLIFAEHESSFRPRDIVSKIDTAHAVCSIQPGTHHGFMNPMSESFREDLAQQHVAHIKQLIAQFCQAP